MQRIPLKLVFLTSLFGCILAGGCASNPHRDFIQEVQNDASAFLDEISATSAHETEKNLIQKKLARLNQDLVNKEFASANRIAEQLTLDVTAGRQTVEITRISNEISELNNEIKGLHKEMEWRTPLTLEQVLPIPETK